MRGGNVDSGDGPSAVDEEDGCLGQQQEWCGVPACKGCPYGRRSDLPPVVSCSVEVGGTLADLWIRNDEYCREEAAE
jgi:hypothetical protein